MATVLLAAAGALALKTVAERLNRRGAPTGAEDRLEFRGHPWFAATYDLVTRAGESGVLSRLRPLVAGEATGTVLEIGAGTGANFPYYQQAEKIVAAEPDPFMLRRAAKRARSLGLDVEFHQAVAEALPFPDASFDTVVATLVFCTVAGPARALAEVRRVLKPGGTFRFIEHVRAKGATAGVQDLLTPVWEQFGAGCHLNRRTVGAIKAAGFEIVEMKEEMPFPLMPLVAGVARPH
ncbi:MAG: class I SAM-dependent methyltransferase [Chloroflexi bacterium]|nr:class I SAM-dependent methyltransferase [Chloroflexota bacterium]